MEDKPSFMKIHSDTIAIIGVNIVIAAILITMWISHAHRIDAVNARLDTLHLVIIDMLKSKN